MVRKAESDGKDQDDSRVDGNTANNNKVTVGNPSETEVIPNQPKNFEFPK